MRTKRRFYVRLLGTLLMLALMAGCGSESDVNVDELVQENQDLKKRVRIQDSIVARVGVGAKFVNAYLDSLEHLEASIKHGLAEQASDSVIIAQVKAVTSLVNINRNIVDNLRNSLGKNNLAAQLLLEQVVSLDKRVKAQELKIAVMNRGLNELGAELNDVLGEYAELQTEYDLQSQGLSKYKDQVKDLESELTSKEEQLVIRERKLNTAFYFFGSKKELQSMDIIKKANLVTFELNEDINLDQLNKVDVREFNGLTIPTKAIKIISDHPSASYKISASGKSSSIKITNAGNFWSITKTLIIQTD
ncbi:MAG: hypothetical protein HQ500_08855 [Flavobacteriales bacterium]|nr:hypothetical protein [Flavobacteriales bacterium]